MTEIAVTELPNPLTGEMVPIADVPAVAATIQQIRAAEDRLKLAKAAFGEVLIQESKRLGKKTLHIAGGYEATIGADTEISWDAEYLLKAMPKAGLPQSRLDELVTTIVEHKVNGNVARQIEGASPAYAKIIKKARVRNPKNVSVRVTGGQA